MHLSLIDTILFSAYFLGTILFAVFMASRSANKGTSEDYFLASRKLPWYVVGASFVASNISTEHFIGMVGWAFLYGMAVANWEWGNAITFTVLIWVFLPFYMRGNVATMPEFLERRFNGTCRVIYAVVMVIGLVFAMLGGVLFAGAKAVNVFFPEISIQTGILFLALAAGIYTVYGGLLSAVWADFLQYCLLMIGGLIVTLIGLHRVGGLGELMQAVPEKFITFYPASHELIPWSGLLMGLLSVGIWYSCANQFMVQRCLAARSEWDARMGVIMAGFSKAFLPFIVVLPGIIAFELLGNRINDGDQAWPMMVRELLPVGLTGLVLAGLASAILSTLSAITTSSSTIITLDLYRKIVGPDIDDSRLRLVGRTTSALVLIMGVIIALILANLPGLTVFGIIQQTFFYMAAPIAACFLIGILWRGATSTAAVVTLVMGFAVYTPLVRFIIFPQIPFFQAYDNFMHHTFLVLLLSGLTLVMVSAFSQRKTDDELKGVVWSRAALADGGDPEKPRPFWQSLKLWWALMFATITGLCAATALFGGRSSVHEAENLLYTATGGATRVEPKGTIEGFNRWTGEGLLAFQPEKRDAHLDLEIPIPGGTAFELSVLTTQGPGYGPFDIFVMDGSNNGRQLSVPNNFDDPIALNHTVQRLQWNFPETLGDNLWVRLIPRTDRKIGIDRWGVTASTPE